MLVIPSISNSEAEKFVEELKKSDAKSLVIKYTIPSGEFCELAIWIPSLNSETIIKGFSLSGIYEGCKVPFNSESIIMPDISQIFWEYSDDSKKKGKPIVLGSIRAPKTLEVEKFDSRDLARRAMQALKKSGFADECKIGPELEFSVFSRVKYKVEKHTSFHRIIDEELGFNGYSTDDSRWSQHPSGPVALNNVPAHKDSSFALRAETTEQLDRWGFSPKAHHHEDAPCQSEIIVSHGNLLQMADCAQLLKYIVHHKARRVGRLATFMPQPINVHQGNGHHVNISLWRNKKNIFAGNEAGSLSKEALFFIGGILKHAKALNCICNPSVNSYRRLANHYNNQMPVHFDYHNRISPIRIPSFNDSAEARIEVRFPDSTLNPYLAYSALLLAGIDGLQNQITPQDPNKSKHSHFPPAHPTQQPSNIRTQFGFSRDLYEASLSLAANSAFLKFYDVFSDEVISTIIHRGINTHEHDIRVTTSRDFEQCFSL